MSVESKNRLHNIFEHKVCFDIFQSIKYKIPKGGMCGRIYGIYEYGTEVLENNIRLSRALLLQKYDRRSNEHVIAIFSKRSVGSIIGSDYLRCARLG
jgi:hypothetical protein